jgi:dinuclear metal center YbgI/SA1388 family protein
MFVSELLTLLNKLAPPGLASSWDNVGLQIGSPEWQVGKILLTLDVTPSVVDYAVKHKFGFIITHHPFIFRPISSVTRPDILALVEHKIAVLAIHTSLDVVPDGVNYALAEILGLNVTGTLSEEIGSQWFHGSVTVPPLYLDKLAEAIHSAGAGRIGLYEKCSTRRMIIGTFRPLDGSHTFLGKPGQYTQVDEVELEFMVDSFNLTAVKAAIANAHPYETPAVWFTEVENANPSYGLGLVGILPKAEKLNAFAEKAKVKLHAPYVQLWTAGKEKGTLVKTVAVCGGAGGSLISKAANVADVFVTGDINYHAMLESRIPLINAGHFYTEFPVLDKLNKILKQKKIASSVYPLSKHDINNNLLI